MNAVIENGFMLEVLTEKYGIDEVVEKIIKCGWNYYTMAEGTEYKLRLKNHHDVRVDAHVWIDGEKIGVWRINPRGFIVIERPANVARRLRLLRERSGMANVAGIKENEENGLVKIIFYPEKKIYNEAIALSPWNKTDVIRYDKGCMYYNDTVTQGRSNQRWCAQSAEKYSHMNGLTPPRMTRGYLDRATALGIESEQRWRTTTAIEDKDIDKEDVTTIWVRLIIDNDKTVYKEQYIGLRQGLYNTLRPPKMREKHPRRPKSRYPYDDYTGYGRYDEYDPKEPRTYDGCWRSRRKYYFDTY